MNRYGVGFTDAVFEYAVKKYKSHHRLRPSIDLFTMEEENSKTNRKRFRSDASKSYVFFIYVKTLHLFTIKYRFFLSTKYREYSKTLSSITFIRSNEQTNKFAIEKYVAHQI